MISFLLNLLQQQQQQQDGQSASSSSSTSTSTSSSSSISPLKKRESILPPSLSGLPSSSSSSSSPSRASSLPLPFLFNRRFDPQSPTTPTATTTTSSPLASSTSIFSTSPGGDAKGAGSKPRRKSQQSTDDTDEDSSSDDHEAKSKTLGGDAADDSEDEEDIALWKRRRNSTNAGHPTPPLVYVSQTERAQIGALDCSDLFPKWVRRSPFQVSKRFKVKWAKMRGGNSVEGGGGDGFDGKQHSGASWVLVFKISDLRPELVSRSEVGRFCVGDCYIVLKAFRKRDGAGGSGSDIDDEEAEDEGYDDTDDNRDGDDGEELQALSSEEEDLDDDDESEYEQDESHDRHHHSEVDYCLWTWIGSKSETDKKFCCAVYAVGLRNWLNVSSSRILRQVEGDESLDFQALFEPNGIEYVDVSSATESGLYEPLEKVYPVRVYQVTHRPHVFLTLVEPKRSSLKSDAVFIVDTGMEIYLWNGITSTAANRHLGRIIADSIKSAERAGMAKLVEVDEETDEDAVAEVYQKLESGESNHPDTDTDIEQSKNIVTESHPPTVTLYRVPKKTIGDDLVEHKVGEAGSVNAKGLQRRLLDSKGCFILDAGVEVFLWIGSKARNRTKSMAAPFLARVIRLTDRPRWFALHRVIDGFESEVFKLKFSDWTHLPQPSKPVKSMDASISFRFLPSHRTMNAEDPLSTRFVDRIRRAMIARSTFAFQRSLGRFVSIDDWEGRGHFCSEDAYVVLSTYNKNVFGVETKPELARLKPLIGHGSVASRVDFLRRLESITKKISETSMAAGDDEGRRGSVDSTSGGRKSMSGTDAPQRGLHRAPSRSSMASTRRGSIRWSESSSFSAFEFASPFSPVVGANAVRDCVVYFWEGSRASRKAATTFELQTRAELEELVRERHRCTARVVHVQQGFEPPEFLALFSEGLVVHRGDRKSLGDKVEGIGRHGGGDEDHQGAEDGDGKVKVLTNGNGGSSRLWESVFHLRADGRCGIAKAIEVQSFLAGDPFGAFVMRAGGGDSNAREYLWIGDKVGNTERARFKVLGRMLYDTLYRKPPDEDSEISERSNNNFSERSNNTSAVSLTSSNSSQPHQFDLTIQIRGQESEVFLALVNPVMSPTFIREHSVPLEKLDVKVFVCHRNTGHFLAEEIPFCAQRHLRAEVCAFVEAGQGSAYYLWTGTKASETLRMLSHKAAFTYIEGLSLGLVEASSAGQRMSLRFEEQGQESVEFKALFHGWQDDWGDVLGVAGGDEPTSRFLVEEKQRKLERKLAAGIRT
ncbi:hypothetical protein HDU76_004826 [Blyttiomyces sp. JEL0837]|nr:hypothetical protein HDU76_004826 [Blyttiomyces sp. JEL0837]